MLEAVQGIAPVSDSGQRVRQNLEVGDRVRCIAPQRVFVIERRDHGGINMGQQGFSDAGAVGGSTGPDVGYHPDGEQAVQLVEVDDLHATAIQDGEVDRLPAVVAQRCEQGAEAVPEIEPGHHIPAETQTGQPQPVAAGLAVVLYKIAQLQRLHQAVGRAGAEAGLPGQLQQRQFRLGWREAIEQIQGPAYCPHLVPPGAARCGL